ncbi:MAG: FIST C-terminal domain-containing protein [Nitrospirae bacterium]|nr:FIST C-terminal domain-containing protein [Nitrospirota bacterium]
MKNEFIKTTSGKDINRVVDEIIGKDTLFILLFYGADANVESIYDALKKSGKYFLGCMDSARFLDKQYSDDTQNIAAMSFSSKLFSDYAFDIVDVSENRSREQIREESYKKFYNAAKGTSIDLSNPEMKRDFAINLVYGLNSATPFLEGQTRAGMMLQTVGGSSGGKADLLVSNVISHGGIGKMGAFFLGRLAEGFEFFIDHTSSFDRLPGKQLVVTKLSNHCHILEFNNLPAAREYASVLGISVNNLSPEIFATYTFGIEPSKDDRLITGIMKQDEGLGLITGNDVVDGSVFNVYKATDQLPDRLSKLNLLKNKNLIAYISFDCTFCYLSRKSTCSVDKMANLYADRLPNVPIIGFGTFGENFCGANIHQTETFIAIYKSK